MEYVVESNDIKSTLINKSIVHANFFSKVFINSLLIANTDEGIVQLFKLELPILMI